MKNGCFTTSICEAVTMKLQHHRFLLGGSLASRYNNQLIHEAIIPWLLLPVESAKLSNITNEYTCRIHQFLNELKRNDFMYLLELLDLGYRCLIRGGDYKSFKATFPESTILLTLPIRHELERWYKEEDYGGLRRACTFLRFLQKLTFHREELECSALCEFLKSEERMRDLDLTGNPYIDDLHKIIYDWISPWKGNLLPVRHGNGSVAEGSLTKAEKYFRMGSDALLENHIRFCGTNSEVYFPFAWSRSNNILDRASRVKFVPKSAKKLRTICMEPITLQYFQQGVMRLMYSYIRRHRYLSQHIMLEDQSQNRLGAKLGSNTNSYCTIDLSAASDSVSWDLVRRLFRGTSYLSWCYVTRSTHNILPDGTRIRSYKFAPMGSALCFPTECLVFCAVVELVAKRHTLFNSNYTYYSVYGDDIICPTAWVSEVIDILESIGFIVNKEKSYWDGPFRESCGKEYYLGRDITPIYYRVDVMNRSLSPTSYGQVCSAANNAAENGFLSLRSYFIDCLMNYKKVGLKPGYPTKPLFRGEFGYSPHIYSCTPTNFHLKSRFLCDLYTTEFTYLSTSIRCDERQPQCVEDTINYHEWLLRHEFCQSHGEVEPFTAKYGLTRPIWNKTRATTTFIDSIM